MYVTITVQLATGEQFTMTSDDVASAVLTALNGDPANDFVSSNVVGQVDLGSAGTPSATVRPIMFEGRK